MPREIKNETPHDLNHDGITEIRRKVVKRSPHRSVGIIACSWLQETSIEYESQLERRFLQQALLLPGLKKIVHQPFRINYRVAGKEKNYTPDFFLLFSTGEKVVAEVKPEVFVAKNSIKFDAASAILNKSSFKFFIITDKAIDRENIPYNAALLLRYARGELAEEKIRRSLSVVESNQPINFKNLLQTAELRKEEAFFLIARRYLQVNLNQEINENTYVHLTNKEQKNASLLILDRFNTTSWRPTT